MFNKQKYAGFSLIELMIVITIIGILAAVAIPSYQHYMRRARFVEVITAAETFKTAVTIAIQQGAAPRELINGKHGIPAEPPGSKNLDSLKVENGVITATGSALVNFSTYILKPNDDGNSWTISGTCLDDGYCDA